MVQFLWLIQFVLINLSDHTNQAKQSDQTSQNDRKTGVIRPSGLTVVIIYSSRISYFGHSSWSRPFGWSGHSIKSLDSSQSEPTRETRSIVVTWPTRVNRAAVPIRVTGPIVLTKSTRVTGPTDITGTCSWFLQN